MTNPQRNTDKNIPTNPLEKVEQHIGIVKMYDTTPKHAMDDHILYLLIGRDKQGISLLYDLFSSNIYGLLLKITDSEVDACKALKSTFIRIWKESEQTDFAHRNLRTWVLGLACKEAATISKNSVSQLPNLLFQ